VLLYLASRGPLLPLGFGNDSDAWSVAANAKALALEHEYRPSRFPGHPFHECLYSLAIASGGALASNLLSLTLSIGLLIVVSRLGSRLRVPHTAWALVAIAVHPLVWVTSADSTDFILAALLGTSALLAATMEKDGWAGLLLGLAGATRPESLLFIMPLLCLASRVRWTRLALAAALTLSVSYLPVILFYRRAPVPLWTVNIASLAPKLRLLIFAAGLWAGWGLLGGLVLVLLLLAHRRGLRDRWSRRDPLLLAVASLLGTYVIVTAMHPSKATYLVPVIPLLMLGLAGLASTRWRVALATALLSYAFVYPHFLDRGPAGLRLGFKWNNGIVVKDFIAKWNNAHAAAVIENSRPRGRSVVVLGYWLPMWRYAHQEAVPVTNLPSGAPLDSRYNAAFRTSDGALVFHNLALSEAQQTVADGTPLLFAEGIDQFMREVHGYEIEGVGGRKIRVRELGTEVAEHFTLPVLVRCVWEPGPWVGCVQPVRGDDRVSRISPLGSREEQSRAGVGMRYSSVSTALARTADDGRQVLFEAGP